MTFLGVRCYGACQDIPAKLKNKLLHLALSATRETQHLVCFLGFWNQHMPHLGVLLAHLLNDSTICSFWEGPKPREGSKTGPGCCAGYSAPWLTWFSTSKDQKHWCSGKELLAGHYRWITAHILKIFLETKNTRTVPSTQSASAFPFQQARVEDTLCGEAGGGRGNPSVLFLWAAWGKIKRFVCLLVLFKHICTQTHTYIYTSTLAKIFQTLRTLKVLGWLLYITSPWSWAKLQNTQIFSQPLPFWLERESTYQPINEDRRVLLTRYVTSISTFHNSVIKVCDSPLAL